MAIINSVRGPGQQLHRFFYTLRVTWKFWQVEWFTIFLSRHLSKFSRWKPLRPRRARWLLGHQGLPSWPSQGHDLFASSWVRVETPLDESRPGVNVLRSTRRAYRGVWHNWKPSLAIGAKGVKNVSRDERHLYEFTRGICSDEIDPRLATQKLGPLNHSRWVTLATRLMPLYVKGQAAEDSVPIFMARKPGTVSAFCNTTVLSRFDREASETKGQYSHRYLER